MPIQSSQRCMKVMEANIATDSTLSLDIERIRKQIAQLYESLLTQAFKAENPVSEPEEIQAFLEENNLEFPEFSEESEVEDLIDMLDDLATDDLDPVESDGEAPTAEKGVEPKSKSHETGKTPRTVDIGVEKGMLTSKPDVQVKKRSKDPVQANSKPLKSVKDKMRKVKVGSLFNGVRDELANIKQRRGIGVKELRDRL